MSETIVAAERPNPNGPRVLLVFPVFAHVYPKAFENFMRLLVTATRLCPQYRFDPWVLSRMPVHGAMNMAVDTALEQGHDYLIAFDDDCIPELPEFPQGDNRRWQVIPRLLALGEKGHKVVTGVGYMRGFPHTTTVGRKYPWGTTLVIENEFGQENPVMRGFRWIDDIAKHADECDANGLLDVDFCGVPIICIHRDVLVKVQKPLFETRDEGGGQSTHDVYFCNKAKAAGFSISVDTHIDCGHIIEAPIINKYTKADMQKALAPRPVEKEIVHA
jgi:hypothetical protein